MSTTTNQIEFTEIDEATQIFIINVSLINPINEIINGLKNAEYRDCDIKWLKAKMDGFIELAAKTLGFTIHAPIRDPRADFTTLNYHVLDYYMERFTTLLNYFQTYL